jgi:transposase-like protein
MDPRIRPNEMKAQRVPATVEFSTPVHCPMCTHNVQATVVAHGRTQKVKPGQKCPRCASTLDAAYVLRYDRAA